MRIKPVRWNFDPARVAPEWQWVRRGLVFLDPFWGGARDLLSGEVGTFNGAAGLQASERGVGYNGTGAAGYLAYAHNERHDWTTDRATQAVWMYVRDVVNTQTWFRKADVVDRLILRQNGASVLWFVGSSTVTVQATDVLTAGRWYAVVAVYDGAKARIYLNGVQVAIADKTGALPGSTGDPIWIGGRPTDRYLNGRILAPMMWSEALTPARVLQWSRDPFGPFRRTGRYASVERVKAVRTRQGSRA